MERDDNFRRMGTNHFGKVSEEKKMEIWEEVNRVTNDDPFHDNETKNLQREEDHRKEIGKEH